MKFYDEVMKRLKQEIADDPAGMGYAGKTDTEIATLMNSDYQRQRTVTDSHPPRVTQVLAGIEGTPNIIEAVDIANAKVFVIS